MRIIEDFDSKNYEDCNDLFHRIAIRAIIIKDQKLALIKSKKIGEFKFPGGGQESGESHEDTLVRETMEETGLRINLESIQPYGMAKEKRKSVLNPNDLFMMESYYYLCQVYDDISQTNLDDYEHEYGYDLYFIEIDEAIKANEHAALYHQDAAPWINRELAVLKDIKTKFNL